MLFERILRKHSDTKDLGESCIFSLAYIQKTQSTGRIFCGLNESDVGRVAQTISICFGCCFRVPAKVWATCQISLERLAFNKKIRVVSRSKSKVPFNTHTSCASFLIISKCG